MEELTQRRGAETFAGVGEGAGIGVGGVVGAVQVSPDERKGAVAEEGRGHDQPDHAVGRQGALPAGMAAALLEDRMDKRDGE